MGEEKEQRSVFEKEKQKTLAFGTHTRQLLIDRGRMRKLCVAE